MDELTPEMPELSDALDSLDEMASPEIEQGMREEEFEAAVNSAIENAVDYIDGYVAADRAKATEYYRGDLFGNEEEGRSQIVMTEVRDTVQQMLPSLLRIFTASENPVEYAPRTAEKIEQAEQATDYAAHVFYSDNPGFQILMDTFKDALIRKTGIVKWRHAEDVEVTEAEYSGLDEPSLVQLYNEPDVEVLSEEGVQVPTGVDQMGQPMLAVMYSVRIRRTTRKNRIVVESVPPEEFLVSRNARDLDTADYVGHRSLKTMSELVSMGYDHEMLEEYAGQGDEFSLNTEAQTRNPAILSFLDNADSPDESMRRVLYVESYVRIDKDGDDIAELRKVCTIGKKVIHDEIATDVPFAVFCPDPEPHMVIGNSISDQVMDLQKIKSTVVRNTMDSLAQVIHPRTVVVEGQVNMDDVMSTETGGIIRARAPGMVTPLVEPFVGQQAMGLISYLDQVRAKRVGVNDASSGLDPDVLQSTTKAAVTATVQGAQERLEVIARVFAETGMKRLFKGLLRLIVRHQDQPRMVRLRGKWAEIDPRYWDADMDVSVNVGLGRGTEQDRLQMLAMITQKQEMIMGTMGPNGPLVNMAQYSNSLAKLVELAGFKDASQHFSKLSQQQVQQMQQQAQGQKPPPDPAMMLAQIEGQKAQVDAQAKMAKMQLEAQKVAMDDDRERDRIEADVHLRAAEIEAKYNMQVNMAEIKADMDRERHTLTTAAKIAATPDPQPQPQPPAPQGMMP